MEAADWTGIGVCMRLVEGVGGGRLRQLAFFGGSLSWHLGGHQAVARAGGLQVPGAEAAPAVGCRPAHSSQQNPTWGRQREQIPLYSRLPPEGSLRTLIFASHPGWSKLG